MTTLAQLAIGARGRVVTIRDADEVSMRLLEMGVTPGTDVTIVGYAPLGDPLELELRGYHLSIRKYEAERVEVEIV